MVVYVVPPSPSLTGARANATTIRPLYLQATWSWPTNHACMTLSFS